MSAQGEFRPDGKTAVVTVWLRHWQQISGRWRGQCCSLHQMPGPESVATNLRIVDSDHPFLVYCNTVSTGLTLWDVRMKIMEVFDRDGADALTKNHGTIVMSPGHAKLLLEALQTTVKQYEERFGEIDLTRIKEAMESAKAKK